MWGDIHLNTEFFEFCPVLASPVSFDVLGETPGEEDLIESPRDLVRPGRLPELPDLRVASEDIKNNEVVTSFDLK